MPPPAKPTSNAPQVQRRPLTGLHRVPAPSQNSDSLFVSNDNTDDDQRWEPPDFDNEEAEDTLGWDASGEMVRSTAENLGCSELTVM